MEEHELISIAYYEGRADKIRPGKPVFRYAFEALVDGESGCVTPYCVPHDLSPASFSGSQKQLQESGAC
jgi:hypothetical protein